MLPLPLLFSLSLLSSLPTLPYGSTINLDLVHRDSPLSPFYNSSSSLSDLIRNVKTRSLTRSRHGLIRPPVIIQGDGVILGEYLLRIYVGSPPLETWVTADTGSDLIWVQCLPCHTCYPQDSPIFNPSKSSTYKKLSCHSKPCAFFPKGYHGCGYSKQCVYKYAYGSGKTFGDLGKDMFGFGGNNDNGSSLVFGCGRNTSGLFSRKASGVVGLGAGPSSLVSQLGPEIGYIFSYCLVPYFSNSIGKLKLGKGAKISRSDRVVSPTPFITGGFTNSNYFLTLEGITVGNKTVKVGPKKGNTLIDSGGTWFIMDSRFYTKVEALIKDSIGVAEVKNASDFFDLCYSIKHKNSIMKSFPDFVVHFKGADLHLKPDHNLLFPLDDLICLAIIPQDTQGSGFDFHFDIGNIPQINFQVEYDLEAKTVSFAPANCSNHNS